MLSLDVFQQPVWLRLSYALLHFLWQGLAVTVALGLGFWIFRVRQARGRYAWSLLALATMGAMPVVTFALLNAPGQPPFERTFVERVNVASAGIANPSDASQLAEAEQPREATDPVSEFPVGQSPTPIEQPVPAAPTVSTVNYLAIVQPYVVLLWLAGVLVLSSRLVLSLAGVYWITRAWHPIPEVWAATALRLGRQLGLRAMPAVRASARVGEAVAAGFIRPVVLVPTAWLTALPPEVLEAVIAHELAHVRRWDVWANLLQRVVETLLFYHPAVWWLSRRVSLAREMCCDELAAEALNNRVAYVNALEAVARLRTTPAAVLLSPAIGGSKMALLNRVQYVLGLTPISQRSGWWPVGLAMMLVPLTIWLGAMGLGPLGTDDSRADELQAQAVAPQVTRFVSPDGRRLAFQLLRSDSLYNKSAELVLANLDGSQRRLVCSIPPYWRDVVWLGNDRLLCSVGEGGQINFPSAMSSDQVTEARILRTLTTLDLSGKELARIEVPDEYYSSGAMHLSPDGARLAFLGYRQPPNTSWKQRQHGLFLMDLKTLQVRCLIERLLRTEPAWSPDSRKLAIGTGYGYAIDHPVVVVDVDRGTVSDTGAIGSYPAWSPDGRYLAYFAGVEDDTLGQLSVWDLKTRTMTHVTPASYVRTDKAKKTSYTGYCLDPVWSPDGRWIAFRTFGTMRPEKSRDSTDIEEVWIANREGTELRKAADFGVESLMKRWQRGRMWRADYIWTPDSRALVLVRDGFPEQIRLDALKPQATATAPVPPQTWTGPTPPSPPPPKYADAKLVSTLRKLDVTVSTDDQGEITLAIVSGDRDPEAAMALPAKMPKLEELRLVNTKLTDASLVHLAKQRQLKRLSIDASKITDAGLAHLQNLTNLAELRLFDLKITGAGLAHLQGLTKLEKLELYDITLDDAAFNRLQALTGLGELYLCRVPLNDARLRAIGQIAGLESLTAIGGGEDVTDAGLAGLAGLAHLKTLRLDWPTVGDAGLASLAKLPDLQDLSLENSQVTDAGLAQLKPLVHFTGLNLSSTGVSDAGLANLEGLTKLESLQLCGTRLTDAGMVHLRRMTKLRYLDLDGTRITDAGLECLNDLPKLRGIGLRQVPNVSLEAIKKLEQRVEYVNY
ncbi:MAG: M56 family metallopeptidase [Thermoguttaceae bacterium]|jgi:beta-lactamase regulating signal transducer with metallopeptidase domain/Tol biopolymer transport system component/Leucine-rich repeat (LRR) protein